MTKEETRVAIHKLVQRRQSALGELLGPARAAVNQMLDAGMVRGAEPLRAALEKAEACDRELTVLMRDNGEAVVDLLLDSVKAAIGKEADAPIPPAVQ